MAKKVIPTPPKAVKGLKIAETNVAAERVEQTPEEIPVATGEDTQSVENTMADSEQEDTNADAQESVESEAEINMDLSTEEDKETDIDVDLTAKPEVTECREEKTKIRLRVDHSCCIAMERYDFVAGKVYTVPKNVKVILNKAGLLAPL